MKRKSRKKDGTFFDVVTAGASPRNGNLTGCSVGRAFGRYPLNLQCRVWAIALPYNSFGAVHE